MKTFIFLVTIHWCHHALYAQKALSFDEAKKNNLRITRLDSIYQSGIHADSAQSVFKPNQQAAYVASYQQMLQELGRFLKVNNFLWDKAVRGFNRIYFDKNGKIDYFLYSFRPGQLTPRQEKKFQKLLAKFVLDYHFPLKAPVKFAQCSPVTYVPAPGGK